MLIKPCSVFRQMGNNIFHMARLHTKSNMQIDMNLHLLALGDDTFSRNVICVQITSVGNIHLKPEGGAHSQLESQPALKERVRVIAWRTYHPESNHILRLSGAEPQSFL